MLDTKLIYVGYNCDFLDLQTFKNGFFIKKCTIVKIEDGKIYYKRDDEVGVKKINTNDVNHVKDFGTSMYLITDKQVNWDNSFDVSDFEDEMLNMFNAHLDKRIEAAILSKNNFNKIAFKKGNDD